MVSDSKILFFWAIRFWDSFLTRPKVGLSTKKIKSKTARDKINNVTTVFLLVVTPLETRGKNILNENIFCEYWFGLIIIN